MSLLHFEFNYLAWRLACQAKPKGRLIRGRSLAWFLATLHAGFKTAFMCYGQFQFQTLPFFRLSEAPSSFQRLMDRLITGWSGGFPIIRGKITCQVLRDKCWIASRKLHGLRVKAGNINLVQAIVCRTLTSVWSTGSCQGISSARDEATGVKVSRSYWVS